MPSTVLAVLAARIDRLPLEEKRRLQTAAVIGTEVPFARPRAIAAGPEGTLHRGLRRFAGHGLTRVRTALAWRWWYTLFSCCMVAHARRTTGNRPRRRLKREQPTTGRSVEAVAYAWGSI